MHTIFHDLRYTLRNLRKSPGFALVAVLTLALGIAASTAIFSVLENILIEPFPYPDAQRFMSIQIHDTEQNRPGGRGGFIGPEFLDYIAQNHVFDRVIANSQSDVLYRSSAGTQLLQGSYITPGTFEFLGMPALLGRVMQPADYEPGAPPVFVLRYKTWVTQFVADPAILNKTFVLNGIPRTLVGIMPPRFGWGDADVGRRRGQPQPALLVFPGTSQTRRNHQTSRSRSQRHRQKPFRHLSEILSKAFHRSGAVAHRSRRR